MTSPLHPDGQQLLALIRNSGRPRYETLAPAEARQFYSASREVLQPPPPEVGSIVELTARGPGGAVPLRYYRPAGSAPETTLPCLVFMHGGGWVIGDLDSHDHMCRTLANEAGCAVLAVHYRLAPEHRFPAAVEDCAAALTHAAREAASLRIDADRIAVGGDSAGGNLTAVMALMGRDGTAPRSCFQMLLYPALDLTLTHPSYERITSDLPLTTTTMRWFRDHYTPGEAERLDWRASPLRVASVAGTPRAFVLTAGHDPLCDEGREYAARLEREQVPVTAIHVADQLHGFLSMGRVIRAGNTMLRVAGHALRAGFEEAGCPT